MECGGLNGLVPVAKNNTIPSILFQSLITYADHNYNLKVGFNISFI